MRSDDTSDTYYIITDHLGITRKLPFSDTGCSWRFLAGELGYGTGQVTTIRGYDAVAGWLDLIESGVGGGTGPQDLDYIWDKVGNLKKRIDATRSLTEVFLNYYANWPQGNQYVRTHSISLGR